MYVPLTVMDLERGGIAEFPHSFQECPTDMKVVQHYAPQKIQIEHLLFVTQRRWLPLCFKGPHFLKLGARLAHFIILDPSLHLVMIRY